MMREIHPTITASRISAAIGENRAVGFCTECGAESICPTEGRNLRCHECSATTVYSAKNLVDFFQLATLGHVMNTLLAAADWYRGLEARIVSLEKQISENQKSNEAADAILAEANRLYAKGKAMKGSTQ